MSAVLFVLVVAVILEPPVSGRRRARRGRWKPVYRKKIASNRVGRHHPSRGGSGRELPPTCANASKAGLTRSRASDASRRRIATTGPSVACTRRGIVDVEWNATNGREVD
jgi:hypothetical protein